MKIKCLVVDDEPLAAELVATVSQYFVALSTAVHRKVGVGETPLAPLRGLSGVGAGSDVPSVAVVNDPCAENNPCCVGLRLSL